MSTPRLVVWCLLFLTRLYADDISLIRIGDPWRYYRGTNEPTSPVTAWRDPAFDDAAWTRSLSAFSTLPYDGDGSREATYLAPSSLNRSFYFRRAFTVTDPSAVKWLVLRLDYMHGFVAYLNGQEILRRGLTGDPVAYDSFADSHPSNTAEEFDITPHAGLLVAGQNVLAIQVHTTETNPPGYANALRFVPELLANFQRGPFIANPATNSIQIVWRTPVAANSSVEFGLDTGLGTQVTSADATNNHVLTLTNLQPDTRYYYRIKSSTGEVTALSPVASFRTQKPAGDFSFLVLADSGSSSPGQYALANFMEQAQPDMVFHCGDIVYSHFYRGREDYRCLSVYGRQMRSVPFYFVLGNEDMETPAYDQPFLDTFFLPTNTMTGTEHFYSFDQGDAHFTALLVPSLKDYPPLRPYILTNGSAQYCWLTNDLAHSTKPWKFIFLHSPVAGSSYHRFDDDNANGPSDMFELRELLLPLARQYGVQIIFSGHEHDFERSNPMGGVYQIVSGGGGGPLPPYYILERDEACAQFFLRHSFAKVAVTGDTLRLEAIGTNGVVFDSMTIRRTVPPPQEYNSTWSTPKVEAFPGNDGYGNIAGQTFDFADDPILTLAGDFSNLGRVYVNNDSTNLYIGFEQALLYSSNNLFLFVESPRQLGVSNLNSLGDGLAGTEQGVDGLDFLENLSFTNFAPSLACLLGDERADGQARTFARPDLAWPVGQGVYRLDSGFSSVEGIRLQQFNRSPQVLEPAPQLRFPEQNANFIKVAIPYTQLGDLRPGDVIKIAAVAGGPGLNTNLQTRQLDVSFLGSSLSGSGLSNVVLGAVSVRLAFDPAGDDDSDGLPNGWELAHGLSPTSAIGDDGASGDPDQDGMTNSSEYSAGTNPRDAASVLRLQLTPLGPAHNLLYWTGVVGRQYQLEISSDLMAFIDHPSTNFPRFATVTNQSFEDFLPTNCFHRAYRLRLVP